MKKRLYALLVAVTMLCSLSVSAAAAEERGDIVILHTNDVHCAYENYDKVAALAKEADLLVDVGDVIQGDRKSVV